MEDSPDETGSPHHFAPHSMREIISIRLELEMASSEAERKQILDSSGTTAEEFDELFDPHDH
ncbi:hypothetical protein [Streptomyces antibioticus]|uniref:hypothetical protein n=1 Tax=Streptomyces antibioticus TaxID=1890 RepID=UPI003D740F2F